MLHLKVVTPDKLIIDETVENVSVPTTTGMITVLDRHIPLVSTIRSGEMIVRKEGEEIGYAVYKGLVNVRPHTAGRISEVIILLEEGELIENLDKDTAEEALKRAHQLDKEANDEHDFAAFEGLVEKELHRGTIVQKWRKHH